MPIVLKTLGDHIRKKRIENELLQRDVALMLFVSVETVTNWENNNTQPQLKHYPAIIAFLGCNSFAVDNPTFAQAIRQYRLAHGLNIARMGALLGAHGSTILAWEKGNQIPSAGHHEKVLLLITTPLNL